MKYLLTLILILTFVSASAVEHEVLGSAMSELDRALGRRAFFIERRQARIDSLHVLLKAEPDSMELVMRIGEQYTGFNNDSAIVYFNYGALNAAYPQNLEFKWKLAAILPLGGFFTEADRLFGSIDSTEIPRQALESYYSAGRQMHSYISSFFSKYPETSRAHNLVAIDFQRRMLSVMPEDSPGYKFSLGEYYFETGRIDMAEVILEEVVRSEPSWSNLRARAANHLAAIAEVNGDVDSKMYYLAISALADVESATREVLSLQELGTTVYATGDIPRAYGYLSKALENAVECGAPLRMVDASKSLPIIEEAHSANIASWRRWMYCIMGFMAAILLALAASILFLRHEMRKMAELQMNLKAANNAKEVYISQFLQLCSIYMDKINQFCKIATRKLASGQSDELLRMVRSGKFVEEQTGEFYEVFDNSFLHIYPNFVDKVNELLRPDAQIVPDSGMRLNTDLRILAFMRLGIEESARIAQILNYSLNTIYSYRNRLKSRALNRDTFETDIMKIQ